MNDSGCRDFYVGGGQGPREWKLLGDKFLLNKEIQLSGAAQNPKALPQEVGTSYHRSVRAEHINAQG